MVNEKCVPNKKCVESQPQFPKFKVFHVIPTFLLFPYQSVEGQRPSKSEGRFWVEGGPAAGGGGGGGGGVGGAGEEFQVEASSAVLELGSTQ